jgi:PKD repeat protein
VKTQYLTPYEPVVANFSGSPTSGAVPLTVTFVNTSTGATSSLRNFGDGYTSTLENPVHVYTATGFFTVSLTAYGATQDTLTRTAYIHTDDGLAQETVIRYTYDPLSRLTGAAYSGAYTYTFAYACDAVGNRTVMTRAFEVDGHIDDGNRQHRFIQLRSVGSLSKISTAKLLASLQ